MSEIMRTISTLTLAFFLAGAALAQQPADTARWQATAKRVTITRDDVGIAHVRGKSDADAVFGMIYAQAEDDFPRIETNYLNALGRRAEADGEAALWSDLRQQLWITPELLAAEYAKSPAWMQTLMQSWADGLNFWLANNPGRAKVLNRFEPWMALAFSEGSIGGDIESVNTTRLQNFFENRNLPLTPEARGAVPVEPSGSNGMAIAPANTKDGHALLLINPHTSFYFRSEAQVQSDAGLNVYGASTWGQFFVYQGWNTNVGWMHTSSGVDVVDEFALTIEVRGGVPGYVYGGTWKPLTRRDVAVQVKTEKGMVPRRFVTWLSVHGPVVRAEGGKWIAVSLMNKPAAALQQSWLRTTATDLASYMKVADLKANSSNATLFASRKGEIAYLHPQFVPLRDNRFDYTRPVDGNDPGTAWKGEHALSELPNVLNPKSGWVMNTNNWPWTAAGPDSPKQAAYPRYMDSAGENPRGINAVKLLSGAKDFTPQKLLDTAYDPWLSAFTTLVPVLLADYDALPSGDPLRVSLEGPIGALRGWDYRSSESSVPTTLATRWGEALIGSNGAAARSARVPLVEWLTSRATATDRLVALAEASAELTRDFGRWDVPFGDINRFQRLSGDINAGFSDAEPSVPIGFSSATWGSLASFGTTRAPGQKRAYGRYGNSFVAVVEFAPVVTARAVSAGGQSSNPRSPHFADQVQRYRSHDFRPAYLTPELLKGHVERVYQPGS